MGKIDDLVRVAIGEMCPDHAIPDQNNYLTREEQFKAPDHSIWGGSILIERKSRRLIDRSQIYQKLQSIAEDQGQPFRAFGMFRTDKIVEKLPSPEAAKYGMTDYMMSQTLKTIKKAKNKFEEYCAVTRSSGLRLLIISDESEFLSSTASDEYFIGRKMGALAENDDQTGAIDAVILVKRPTFVLDVANSYWFKLLIKSRVGKGGVATIENFADGLKQALTLDKLFEGATRFQRGFYRSIIV